MNWKPLLVGLVAALGAFFVITGVADIYGPAGLIVAGLMILAVALLPDWGA
jgi:hypothetical protein